MTEYREYRNFSTRYILWNIPVVTLGFIAGGWVLFDAENQGPLFWICLGVFICTIITNIAMDSYRYRHFRCPECGTILPKPKFGELRVRDLITFYCASCDIEWDSGLRVAGG